MAITGARTAFSRPFAVFVLILALSTAMAAPTAAGPGDTGAIAVAIADGNDDAEERSTGSILIGSSDLELTNDGGGDQTVGLRFASVPVPDGATVTSAWIQFTVDEVSVEPTDLTIAAEAADVAAAYTNSAGSITARALVDLEVAWTPAPWPTTGEAGPDQRTPDIAPLVQAVIDRPGWAPGNPVNIVISGTGERVAESFEGNAGAAPVLHIDYVEALDTPPTVAILAPADGFSLMEGTAVSLQATADDAEDGDLTAAIVWSSSLDGGLGSGSPLVVDTLSIGVHTITAVVTDSFGQTRSATVGLTIESANPATVVETRVASSSDDAEERASGTVLVSSSDLELTFDGGGHQVVGVRFASLDVPPNAEVTRAWIQFTVDENSTDPTNLMIRGEATDQATPYSGISGSISSRAQTAAAVSWDPAPWVTVGEAASAQQTPDLAAIVAEVITRPGWNRGDPLAFLITGTGKRVAESFNGSSSRAPLLHVEYLSPDNSAPTVTIAPPPGGTVFQEDDSGPLTAQATDLEDGDLSASVQWTSDRDGAFGSGSSASIASLGVGIHTITATVLDSGGSIAADTLRISVETAQPFFVGAGDIAECGDDRDEATAELIEAFPSATVFTLGDNAYPDGTISDFDNCYEPSWGSFKQRTFPAVGNHDYFTPGAAGYFSYFGEVAGDPTEGWYSYDLGTWHVIVLNSNCSEVGGCSEGSAQAQWLEADLAANPAQCTVAYWHHPQFSSGLAPNGAYEHFWELLHDAGADLILNAHSHHYERFAHRPPRARPTRLAASASSPSAPVVMACSRRGPSLPTARLASSVSSASSD